MTTHKSSAEARTRDTLDDLAEAADTAVHDVLGGTRSRVRNAARAGRDRFLHMRDSLEDRVVERPIQTLAIAAAIGVIFGMLLHRRRD